MANEKRLIVAHDLWSDIMMLPHNGDMISSEEVEQAIMDAPTVDAVEVPCHCCDCYYLLNGKNSFGLYFFCGHQNGLKNLRNTEKDFCLYAERRYGDGNA